MRREFRSQGYSKIENASTPVQAHPRLGDISIGIILRLVSPAVKIHPKYQNPNPNHDPYNIIIKTLSKTHPAKQVMHALNRSDR